MIDRMADLTVQREEVVTVFDNPMFLLLKYILVLLICTFWSCSRSESTVVEAPSETICRIVQKSDEEVLGRLNSFAVVDKESFVLCTEEQVYLYDMSGRRLFKIGTSGNSDKEYLMPMIVRTDGNLIYVWSAMNMRFVVYDIKGNFIKYYSYKSAIRDFLPARDCIFIYPAGLKDDHIVEIYDTASMEVSESIGTPTFAHKVLLGWMSAAPLCYKDGDLYFLPMDKLSVMKYSCNRAGSELVASLYSDTFKVESIDSELDNNKQSLYRYANSYTLMLFNRDDRFYILTSEGKYIKDGDMLSDENRFCSLYRIAGKTGERIMSFTMGSFAYGNLLSVYDGNLYFIAHSVEDAEDIYTIKQLQI